MLFEKGDKVLLRSSNDKDLLLKPFTVTQAEDRWGKVKAALSTETHYYSIYTEAKNLIKIDSDKEVK